MKRIVIRKQILVGVIGLLAIILVIYFVFGLRGSPEPSHGTAWVIEQNMRELLEESAKYDKSHSSYVSDTTTERINKCSTPGTFFSSTKKGEMQYLIIRSATSSISDAIEGKDYQCSVGDDFWIFSTRTVPSGRLFDSNERMYWCADSSGAAVRTSALHDKNAVTCTK